MTMKIALCQLNPTVGDFDGNRRRILEAAAEARRLGADWALFSELALSGYPPEDLLLRAGFIEAHDRALAELAASLPPDLPCLVGCLERNPEARSRGGRPLFNAAAPPTSSLHSPVVIALATCQQLPTPSPHATIPANTATPPPPLRW